MRERLPLLGGLALLAIAFVIGAVAIGHGIRDKNRNDVIVVSGSRRSGSTTTGSTTGRPSKRTTAVVNVTFGVG
jgi:hypothetical protein